MTVDQQVAQILKALQDTVKEYGPEGIHLALSVLRFEAIMNVVFSLGAILVVWVVSKRIWEWRKKALEEDPRNDTAEIGSAMLLGMMGLLTLMGTGTLLLSARTWMAIYDPRLALAYDILRKVLRSK